MTPHWGWGDGSAVKNNLPLVGGVRVEYAFNPSPWEAVTGRSLSSDRQVSEIEVSLVY